MTRWLICMALVFTGCVATLPLNNCAITADLACETARQVVKWRSELPPTPDAGDACENCGGKGTLGDGRITVKCPACGGTGKKPKSVCVNCK